MPVTSPAQFGAMASAIQGNSKLGIPQNVGKEFLNKTPSSAKSKFAKALVKKKKAKVPDTDQDGF